MIGLECVPLLRTKFRRQCRSYAQPGEEPPQNLREYDPEWARAFVSGTVAASCNHARMLAAVKVPVLFTHHFHMIDPATGHLLDAVSDMQASMARELITGNGQTFDYRVFPEMGHFMHGIDPALYATTVIDWWAGLSFSK